MQISRSRSQRASALLIILAFVTLLTVLVVSLLLTARFERTSSNLALGRAQAEVLADFTAETAMERIREAIDEGGKTTGSSYNTWASEPGRIHVFTIAQGAGEISRKAYDLFSGLPGGDDAQVPELNNVDLNKASISGIHPVTGSRPGTMKVGWTNILANPDQDASKDNRIVGRVAYWVDDESCKVNINTADGSQRMNATPTPATLAAMASTQKYSFGFGTPSEISLAALPGLDQTKAAAIADYPWQQEFNSTEEITRAKDSGGNQVVTKDMLAALRFDITHYNSSPDLNFMGEPRISLLPAPISATTTITSRQNTLLGPYVKTQAMGGSGIKGAPLDHIYPQPSQLTKPPYLPLATDRLFLHSYCVGGGQFFSQIVSPATSTTNYDYYVGKVITSFLNGTNLKGQSFTWPKFAGADSAGFAGKYTPRQLDSIALQILDTVGKITLCDQNRPYNFPATMVNGWLSNEPVLGAARTLKLSEILIVGTVGVGDPFSYGAKIGNPAYSYPSLTLAMTYEMVLPEGFGGMSQSAPYDRAIEQAYNYTGGYNTGYLMNYYDAPMCDATPARVTGNSETGSMWMDQMLTALDQSGQPAGIDFAGAPWCAGTSDGKDTGTPLYVADPDQTKAANYHPFTMIYSGTGTVADPWVPTGTYSGDARSWTPRDTAPERAVLRTLNSNSANSERAPGVYAAMNNYYASMLYYAKPGITSLRIVGGLNHWLRFGNSYGYCLPIFAPFDSAVIAMAQGAPTSPAPVLTPAQKSRVLETVIPVDFTIPVPGTRTLLIRTSDPLVAHFPKDWELVPNPAATDITMPILSGGNTASYYKKGGAASLDPFFPPSATVLDGNGNPTPVLRPNNFDGRNTKYRASGGGDQLSVWLPNQDTRIPKLARFPSVGALFSIRTGLFPDKTVAALPYSQQHGVAFRGLNMAPANQSSQATEGGTSYPDWAMLDLFTVPFLPQKPYMEGDPAQPFRRLTYGGATIGRMNINNPEVQYPFAEPVSGVVQNPPKRNALKALFQGLTPSNSYLSDDPVYTTIDAAGSATLAQAISDYQKTYGPFFMAGQVANVPAVASYLYTGIPYGFPASSVSRNDVVRDIVGAITTRSNVYSVWVVAQTIKKKPANTGYAAFERGDIVTSEVRRRYLVERFIETGKDGVPGNVAAPSVTDTPNAYAYANTATNILWDGDKANATYHPALSYPLPYRWRVVAVENFQF